MMLISEPRLKYWLVLVGSGRRIRFDWETRLVVYGQSVVKTKGRRIRKTPAG